MSDLKPLILEMIQQALNEEDDPLMKRIKNADEDEVYELARHKDLKSHHMGPLLDRAFEVGYGGTGDDIAVELNYHPKMKPAIWHKFFNSDDDDDSKKIAAITYDYNGLLTPKHLDAALQHRNHAISGRVIDHPKVTRRHIEQLTDHPDSSIRRRASEMLGDWRNRRDY